MEATKAGTVMATTSEELHSMIDHLSAQDQERILAYVRELAQPQPYPHTPLPPGTPGHIVAQLSVSPEVGEAMEQALEETERIDPDGWE